MTKEEKIEVRRFLGSYRMMKYEIKAREKELESFIREMYNPLKATIIDGMPKSGRLGDTTGNAVASIEKTYVRMMREMQTRIEELERQKRHIEAAIATLDGYERAVCYARYILGVYWVDLPEHVGYEVAQCQRIESRALTKIKNYLYPKT